MKRLFVSLMAVALLAGSLTARGTKLPSSSVNTDKEIVIVYTNDIHSYVGNEKTIEETKEKVPGLRISKISKIVKDLKASGKEVLLIDCGDQIQGTSYGSYDKGKSIIKIMNAAGYQLATPGNHDFDYGVKGFLKIASKAKFDFVSCNFKSISKGREKQVLKSSKIFNVDGKKIAFIGISTPETVTSSTPVLFQDGKGNYIYSFDGQADCSELYKSVQRAIDEVKGKVDYIIALGHVGIGLEQLRCKISSQDVIENTSGLNAFIDGHSHTTVEGTVVKDKDGKDVLLTQTGSFLAKVGVMTIGEDKITSKLLSDYDGVDEAVAAIENNLIETLKAQYSKKIAVLDTELYINNPANQKQRLIRAMDFNTGDFVADSVYWYLNNEKQLECDIALQNAGGIRNYIKAGDVLLSDVINVAPFGNMICLISATGQQIKDALEMGATAIGLWDEQWNAPAENGGFLQVAGMRYTIDGAVKSNVSLDSNRGFKSVDGSYKVKDIEVYNKTTGTYEPIDLKKEYKVGGINYILKNGGNGLAMFTQCKLVVDFIAQDSDVLTAYFKSFAKNGAYPEVKTENSELIKYKNYQINYENPFGAGRIKIENVNFDLK